MRTALHAPSLTLLAMVFLLLGSALAADSVLVSTATMGPFEGGARSQRELIDRLLAVLQKKDDAALRSLRVTEAEYRDIILPGTTSPGNPPRTLSATWLDYAWKNLNDRSTVHEQRLLHDFGGRDLGVIETHFEGGEKRYAGYNAYVQLRLTVRNTDGAERELRTGSIAEVAGTYKFISFVRD